MTQHSTPTTELCDQLSHSWQTAADATCSTPQVLAKVTPATFELPPSQIDCANTFWQLASSLFAALRARDPASAAHSLRVSMGCSAWGMSLGLPDEQTEMLEVAALLHDLGKMTIPDTLLFKPSPLHADELALIRQHRDHGLHILSAYAFSSEMIDVVRFAQLSCSGNNPAGERLPLGARILSIVDAFDSMVTDHSWRKARSLEQAMGELCEFAGPQFDPKLVSDFCLRQAKASSDSQIRRAHGWLRRLLPEGERQFQRLAVRLGSHALGSPSEVQSFQEMLIENMQDAIIFVDDSLKIVAWNDGAERLTGIPRDSVLRKRWLPRLVGMSDQRGVIISDDACPVVRTIHSGTQQVEQYTISGRDGVELRVKGHLMPVTSPFGNPSGAVVLLHDMSTETILQRKVKSLSDKVTYDALTKVANRAEFDRSLNRFIDSRSTDNRSSALVLCDIDHFKSINDTYGHQAGDDALVTFAAVLKKSCRAGDVVSRYGGEEFALLLINCDSETAADRAEHIRRDIAVTPHHSLGGTCFTASFGVTEIEATDTPESVLGRVDRALYEAKEMGRNMVVQQGCGKPVQEETRFQPWWKSWLGAKKVDRLIDSNLVANVPLKLAAEKLRGFVSDQQAKIIWIDEEHIILKIDGLSMPLTKRNTDRPLPLEIEITFREDPVPTRGIIRTHIHLVIRSERGRERRRSVPMERARQIFSSLKAYLMAYEELDVEPSESSAQPASDAKRDSESTE